MKTVFTYIFIIITSLTIICCNDSNKAITPRPIGYARITPIDSTYTHIQHHKIYFATNNSAQVIHDSTNTQWYNIVYPQYNAIIYCSFTPTTESTIAKIIQNRVERISLNIGDNPSISTELKNDNNFVSTIIKTPTGTINPLQFISTDNVSWVISGTLLLKESLSSKSDSLLPVIDAIERDIIYALENINLIEP